MMDDIIDLELEKIDSILSKIDADPESDELKLLKRTSGKTSGKNQKKAEEQA